MHPDLTIAVAHDRHVRRTAAVEERSARPVVPVAVPAPIRAPASAAPAPLRLIPGGRPSGPPSTRTRSAA